jgi:predicted DNA-binding transcriptional regulator AlpA
MAEYAAHVTTDLEHITDDQLDDLVDALAHVYAVPSMLGGRLSVQLTVTCPPEAGLVEAHREAVRHVLPALAGLGLRAHVVAVEVLTAEEFARRQGLPPRVDDVVSTTEAGEMLGVSRQRVLQLAERDDFPEPIRLGQRDLVWSADALRRFAEAWDRRPGPKKVASG